MKTNKLVLLAVPFGALLVATVAVPTDARAMCGCMIGPVRNDPREQRTLPNKSSVVVMMREGTKTVLSFQNDYHGPPEGFALVVPVPIVLRREDVRTLDRGVFARVQAIAAPRLVELWEQNPCPVRMRRGIGGGMAMAAGLDSVAGGGGQAAVTVEAQFAVGEYDIVVLGAAESTALEQWLQQNHYAVPSGVSDALGPYVQAGMKFFVARVDPRRMQGEFLTPLRVQFDSEQFSLPVRLGLYNSTGEQDLAIHILAPAQRYEMANYGNMMVPTDIRLAPQAARSFATFYSAFFSRLSRRYPRRVMTEFAGPIAGSRTGAECLGCGLPRLSQADLNALGEEVLPGHTAENATARYRSFVLTRLHYRYGRADLPDDLVFRAARPVQGGNRSAGRPGAAATVRRGATSDFRTRFIVKHYWGGATCANPRRGQWGGQPGWGFNDDISNVLGAPRGDNATPDAQAPVITDPRRIPLERWIQSAVPQLGIAPPPP